MNHYVLVHGAWEGDWSWESVVPLLEKSGHEVTTVALPGSSSNQKPVTQVQVAERYSERIERLVYVTAFLIPDGANALETMQSDPAGQLLPQLVFSEDQSYATVSEDVRREVAFHDATAAAIGAKVTRPPGPMSHAAEQPGPGDVLAFIEDPDGYRIELIEKA